MSANPEVSEKIKKFKVHLKEKLSRDFSIRRERRLSTGSFRSRLPSAPNRGIYSSNGTNIIPWTDF